ncbi:ComEC/Rec2 family competence protein [Patescibacteria group bacterium]
MFIETPSGNQILIDGGDGEKIISELSKIIPFSDKNIDIIISTHTDSDHLGGLINVLKAYDVGIVLENGFIAESATYKEWAEILKEKNINSKIVKAGDRMVIDDGIILDILGPFSEDFNPYPEDGNEVMIAAKLTFKDSEFLFMGDIDKGDELRLISSGLDLDSDVLKVAHHGSKNSSTNLFLEKVSPEYAVISAGYNNRYGHPHAETLERLASVGTQIFVTSNDMAVTIKTDGNILEIVK